METKPGAQPTFSPPQTPDDVPSLEGTQGESFWGCGSSMSNIAAVCPHMPQNPLKTEEGSLRSQNIQRGRDVHLEEAVCSWGKTRRSVNTGGAAVPLIISALGLACARCDLDFTARITSKRKKIKASGAQQGCRSTGGGGPGATDLPQAPPAFRERELAGCGHGHRQAEWRGPHFWSHPPQ